MLNYIFLGVMASFVVAGIAASFLSTSRKFGGMTEQRVHAEYMRVMAARKAREEEQEKQRQAELVDAVAAKVGASLPTQISEEESEERKRPPEIQYVGVKVPVVQSELSEKSKSGVPGKRHSQPRSNPKDQAEYAQLKAEIDEALEHVIALYGAAATSAVSETAPRGAGIVSADDPSVVENEQQMLGEEEMKVDPKRII